MASEDSVTDTVLPVAVTNPFVVGASETAAGGGFSALSTAARRSASSSSMSSFVRDIFLNFLISFGFTKYNLTCSKTNPPPIFADHAMFMFYFINLSKNK